MAMATDIAAKDSASLAGMILNGFCISKTLSDENSVSGMSVCCLLEKYTEFVEEIREMSNPLPLIFPSTPTDPHFPR